MTDSSSSNTQDQNLSNGSQPTHHARKRRTAWMLSLGGFAPFAFMAVALFVIERGSLEYYYLVDGLKIYGAVILSFLGGVRWGIALITNNRYARRNLIFSVLPALLGWAAFFLPVPYSFGVLALGFAAQGAWDAMAGEQGTFALWFGQLRIVLTFLVTGALVAAFFATV